MNDDFPVSDDPKCAECKKSIEEGSVVAFGNHIWHVECFRCAKCQTLVDHDSNLLLLSNGKPICENCSYNCRVCDKKIDDLAIMTGDESYHSECFRCRLCQKKIEDLVFAKTSQGIYCIACHNGRMSKSRKNKLAKTASYIKDSKDKNLPATPAPAPHAPDTSTQSAQTTQQFLDPRTPSSNDLVIPSPGRRPPAPPLIANNQALSSPAVFDDFDFNLGVPPRSTSSASVPFFIEEQPPLPSQQIQANINTIGFAASELPDSGRATSERSTSVRERRRPTEAELRLPKSEKELADVVSRQHIKRETTDQSVDPKAVFLQPSRLNEHLQVQTPQSVQDEVMEAPPRRERFARSHSGISIPSTPMINVTPFGKDEREKISVKPTTPDKPSRTMPAIPPRSADRLPGLRNAAKKEVSPSGPLHSADISQGSRDKEAVARSILTPPRELARPPTPDKVNQELTMNGASDLTIELDAEAESKEAPGGSNTRDSDHSASPQSTEDHMIHPASSSMKEQSILASNFKSPEGKLPTNTAPATPVTSFESDLSKAFNLSPRIKSDSPQANVSGLERNGTISRIANKMLKHKKSVSGGALNPKASYADHRRSVTDASIDIMRLQEQLKLKDNRMSQLEDTLRQVQDSKQLEKQLEFRKSLLATLEGQIAQQDAENRSYLQHRYKLSDSTLPLGEWEESVVADLQSSLKNTKRQLTVEIELLIRQRNDLKLENERLQEQKSSQARELEVMEKKYANLTAMNDSMLKQIQSNMEANKQSKQSGLRPDAAFPTTSRSQQVSPSFVTSDSEHKNLSDANSEADMGYALSGSTTQDHNIEEEEEEPVVDAAVKRLSGERNYDIATPKKFNLVKKTKKAFRWGKSSSQQDITNGVGHINISSPSASFDSRIMDRPMTGSKSSDKLSNKTTTGGMFKRTWQSQHNLSSQLDPRFVDSSTVSLFGNDLTQQSNSEGRLVPDLVTSCIAILESRALEFEGLYRKSGGAGEMKSLIEAFETANLDHVPVNFSAFTDTSAISSVLKQYLRRLPNPLISFDSYEAFIGTSAIPDSSIRVRVLKDVLRDLPQSHYQTLKTLLSHLHKVSTYSEKNLMTSKNLAVVLGPTIVWDQAGQKEIQDMHDKTACIQFCIEHAGDL